MRNLKQQLSSTSGIMPSELQANLSHPERLVVAHPFHRYIFCH